MKYYLAPLEGITTYVYRNAYHHNFGGVDRYFTPFMMNKKMAKKEIDGILPENNKGMELIPQIMSNNAEDFLELAREIEGYGYDTVNLNVGCPSGTVVAKKRGAGFLAYPDDLERFLSKVYEKCSMKVSVKTRIGLTDEAEWDRILSIYEQFPMEELIIHPRLRSDYYKEPIRMNAFSEAMERMKVPICYNGEINSVADAKRIEVEFPKLDRMMLGRGILRNPNLVQQIRGEKLEENELRKRIIGFHEELVEGYQLIMPGDTSTLFKMKELWSYLGTSFDGAEKYLKQIKKTKKLSEYQLAARGIFRDCPLHQIMIKL